MGNSIKPSTKILELLKKYESRNIIFIDPDGSWPIVWERARGVYVFDIDGKRYIDLTGAFGVATAGHANPRIISAAKKQLTKLPHAMGDVHPNKLKALLAQKLSKLTFEHWLNGEHGKTIFCNSGFEAVEAALKTAHLATKHPHVLAFEGAYHGLGYGTLNITHREYFKKPFFEQLGMFGHFAPFPTNPTELETTKKKICNIINKTKLGAILVEPIQGRGGIRVPTPSLFAFLRQICDKTGAILIFDEIYTGIGRTGKMFACEHYGVFPDIICLGKALTGGFPLSACVGRAKLMDKAWEPSKGEAIHTSTFLGNPVGCAMALACLEEVERKKLPERSAKLGAVLLDKLKSLTPPHNLVLLPRGMGLMAGLEIRHNDSSPASELVYKIIKEMLQRGFILLPEGEHGNVISFTPPLIITRTQLTKTINMLQDILNKI
ncbi:MAG: aspartate aminotransferase family protein [Verrucomicrobiae bacterium]|nr:aspartate aminotransferase family protein [Verrucomicrobiae bacterium]